MSGKKQQRTKSEHYVAQFYLRGFTNENGLMFSFDKVTDNSHPTTTAAAAQEPYFYEIPNGSFRNVNVPVNAVEKALSVSEKAWAPLHAALIRSAHAGRIPAALTIEYAPFLVMQWLRTRSYRDRMHELAVKSTRSVCDDLMEVNFPGEKKPKIGLAEHSMPAVHFQKFLDPQTVERISDCLEHHVWVVGINKSEHLFYTSDSPVVRRGNRHAPDGRLMLGVHEPGIEIVFPLDSGHILLILERQHFANWRKHDNRGIELTAEQVRDYNGLAVFRSNQRVFCANNDFDLAREQCVAHPEIRDPNRPRVRVVTTPIVSAGLDTDGKQLWKNQISATPLE